ncbi:MAG: M48 family metalloprotease, partial [Candidatus Eremiobacterota bacterium]
MFKKILTELCLITVLFLGISSQAWALFPMGMEIHMGEDAAIKIENTYPATEDKRVTEIGNKLAQYSIRNGLEYKFKVLHGMRQENAFALPGGYVYITEELLDYTGNDDDQLAFILGHEIGHCDARHAMEKYETGLIVSIIFGTTMKGSDYAGIVASIASLSFLKYSRNDEIEADNFGFRFCYRTGYNPVKGLKVFKHFAELSGGGNKSDFLSTHPNPDSRIENAIKFMTAVDQAGGVVAYDLANKNYDYICVAGFWNSNIGKIMLVQDDADIYGICEDKLWKFEGKIKNKGLEIEWEDLRDENIKGTASLELKPDGSICSGKWYTGENQEVSQDATFTDRHLYDGPNRSANRYAGNEFKGIDLETAGTYFICKANDTYYNITGVKEGSATYAEEQLEICKKSCETPKELDFEENWGYKPGAFAGIKEFSFDLPGEVTFYANKALECFEIDVKQSPDDEDALLLLGVARVWKEDIDGGIKCFEDALIQDPSNEKACINAGDCYLWKKDEARALEYYKKAVTANPQSSTAYNRLGIYYYSKNQYREASEEFTEATKINVKDYCDYGNAALCYYKLGEFDKARRQLDFAATFNAEYAPVYYYQGRL